MTGPEVPSVGWVGAQVVDGSETVWSWSPQIMSPGMTLPETGFAPPGNTISMTVGQQLKASVITVGSLTVVSSFAALGGAGGYLLDITPDGAWALDVGMWMVPVTGIVPNGLQIVQSVAPPTAQIVLGGEEAMADIINGISPADAKGVFVLSANLDTDCTAVDAYPYGTLAVEVTPSTGVTIVDWNYDGTGNSDNVGNGTAMCNSGDQATGDFGITFADAGTYTLSVSYTSTDENYSDATVEPVLTVDVAAA